MEAAPYRLISLNKLPFIEVFPTAKSLASHPSLNSAPKPEWTGHPNNCANKERLDSPYGYQRATIESDNVYFIVTRCGNVECLTAPVFEVRHQQNVVCNCPVG